MRILSLPSLGFCLLLATGGICAHAQDISITEFVAENENGLEDEEGDQSDWIELFNSGESLIDLRGYRLSDNPDAPDKWIFPAVSIGPGEYLIVFASGKDRRVPLAPLHTNFALESSGEYLALRSADGVILSEFAPAYPPQHSDVSFGVAGSERSTTAIDRLSPSRWQIPVETTDLTWIQPEFDDEDWLAGEAAVGFDSTTDFLHLYVTNIGTRMKDINGSVYLRIPFEILEPSSISGLELWLQYDDGFVAYLNGERVASAFAPEFLQWNSTAIDARPDDDVIQGNLFDLTPHLDRLQTGANILAIHGLNRTIGSEDFLISPELRVLWKEGPVSGYLPVPTPLAENGSVYEGVTEPVRFSHSRGVQASSLNLSLHTPTPDSSIFYTTNGSDPRANSRHRYTGPLTITETTVIRSVAVRPNWLDSATITQTYLFPRDIHDQPRMNPEVVYDPVYQPEIVPALAESLPVVALSFDDSDFFGPWGIYSNPESSGDEWEVPVSMEYFNPNSFSDQFQINAGVRIHGGNARTHPKKPLRLYFRNIYSEGKLRYPLFPNSPVEEFDQLILRSGGHDSWSLADTFGDSPTDLPPHGTFLRDQFVRLSEQASGSLSPSGKYVHLYLNGAYWGIFDLHERANAAFFSDHLGGEDTDWDVIHHPDFVEEDYAVVDGDGGAWFDLQQLSQTAVLSPQHYEELERHLEMDRWIDSLIIRIWSGDYDWCGPIFQNGADVTVFDNKNWYAAAQTRNGNGRFHTLVWDAEMSMGQHLMANLSLGPRPQQVTDFDLTLVGDRGSPTSPYAALRNYPPFQRRFGDRIQRIFFGNGALTPGSSQARLASLVDTLDPAIIAESARWGKADFMDTSFTRDEHWRPEVDWLHEVFLPVRHEEIISQFRAAGLYPETNAPAFNAYGGEIEPNFPFTITVPEGTTAYYTVDGSDPAILERMEMVPFIDEGQPADVIVPSTSNGASTSGLQWTQVEAPPFPSLWTAGSVGVGYEFGSTDYLDLIQTDVGEEMFGVTSSVYIRIPFDVTPASFLAEISSLTLGMKFDDGFVAFLNGQEIARANAPPALAWDSQATTFRPDTQALTYQEYDITEHINLLRVGENLLAIQGLNQNTQSSDLLFVPRLLATRIVNPSSLSPGAILYENELNLTESTTILARARDANGNWSALTSAHFSVKGDIKAGDLAITEIHYHPAPPNGSEERNITLDASDFEFIEVTNNTGRTVNTTGVSLTEGVRYVFPPSTLSPGESAVVVKNHSAFQARYGRGANLRVSGEFTHGTQLDNNGETLTLLSADGERIESFIFSNTSPWPMITDGAGPSLTRLQTSTTPSIPESWAPSHDLGGQPGWGTPIDRFQDWVELFFPESSTTAELPSLPEADPDNDGLPNLVEYALASHPLKGDSTLSTWAIVPASGDATPHVDFYIRPNMKDLSITYEISPDLEEWSPLTPSHEADDPRGRQVHRIILEEFTAPQSPLQFVRLRATLTND